MKLIDQHGILRAGHSFEPTYKELKQYTDRCKADNERGFEPTYKELKLKSLYDLEPQWIEF